MLSPRAHGQGETREQRAPGLTPESPQASSGECSGCATHAQHCREKWHACPRDKWEQRSGGGHGGEEVAVPQPPSHAHLLSKSFAFTEPGPLLSGAGKERSSYWGLASDATSTGRW